MNVMDQFIGKFAKHSNIDKSEILLHHRFYSKRLMKDKYFYGV